MTAGPSALDALWPRSVPVAPGGPLVTVVTAPGGAAASVAAQSVPAHQVLESTSPRDVADHVTGTHVLLLGPHDRLDPVALQVLGATLAERRRPVLVWADSDTVDGDGVQVATTFRTEWDPARLPHAPVVGGPAVVETAAVEAVGGWAQSGTAAELWWDLTRRLAPRLTRWTTAHVPAVLSHHLGPVAGPPAVGADLANGPRTAVSVLIPTAGAWRADGSRHVDALLTALLGADNGVDVDVVVAVPPGLAWRPPADRRVRVVTVPGPFSFSRTTDVLALHARTDLLLMLNDDVVPLTGDWLLRMVAQVRVPGVGAVGARLEYPDGRLQHIGLAQVAGLPFHVAHRAHEAEVYDALATLPHASSSVTAACLLTPRAVFERVGGLTQDLPMNFNDVDYGLTLGGLDLAVVVEPRARLVHHESASREAVVRTEEVEAFLARWPQKAPDPWMSRPRAFAAGLGAGWLAADALVGMTDAGRLGSPA